MARVNGILAVACVVAIRLQAMMPFSSDRGTCWDVDDVCGERGDKGIGTAVADDIVRCYVGDRAVVLMEGNRELSSASPLTSLRRSLTVG